MIIQVVLVALVVALGWYTLRAEPGSVHLALRRGVSVVVIILALVTVLYPDLLTGIARFFGIGRGADLLIYGLVLAFILNVFSARRKVSQIERVNTKIAREVALLEFEQVNKRQL